jgi:hypothetical protein
MERLSVIAGTYNRANLLYFSLWALSEQEGIENLDVEINLGDDGSTDNLDFIIEFYSKRFGWSINRYDMTSFKEAFDRPFNCPGAKYNALVALSSAPYVMKIDPEFVLLTKGFVRKSLEILRNGSPAMIMPFPHHTYEFPMGTLNDIRERWSQYHYETHIKPETAQSNNVYYGCMFSRKAYLDLGGIDIRFLKAIGSEDDHLMDQWRRKYGSDHVRTLIEEEGVHLWHGEWGKMVPQEYWPWVEKNTQLRRDLSNTYPNNGDFESIKYPDVVWTGWKEGHKILENEVKKVCEC